MDHTKNLDRVVTHLQNTDSSAFVFANTRKLTHSLVKSLESKLDANQIRSDVVHIHGKLSKEEKFHLINFFCGKSTIKDFDPKAMVATSSADLGVDHPDAQCIIEMQWSDSPSTYGQRRGRGGRLGQLSIMITIAGITAHIELMQRIYLNRDIKASDNDLRNAQALIENMAFKPNTSPAKATGGAAAKYPLTAAMKKRLQMRQITDHMAVILFLSKQGLPA